MNTKIFKDYIEFEHYLMNNPESTINGVSQEFVDDENTTLQELDVTLFNCDRCWNCKDCSYSNNLHECIEVHYSRFCKECLECKFCTFCNDGYNISDYNGEINLELLNLELEYPLFNNNFNYSFLAID